jgi:hypothetical protein
LRAIIFAYSGAVTLAAIRRALEAAVIDFTDNGGILSPKKRKQTL